MSYDSSIIPVTLIAYILLIGAITILINKKWLLVDFKKFVLVFIFGAFSVMLGFFMIPIHFP